MFISVYICNDTIFLRDYCSLGIALNFWKVLHRTGCWRLHCSITQFACNIVLKFAVQNPCRKVSCFEIYTYCNKSTVNSLQVKILTKISGVFEWHAKLSCLHYLQNFLMPVYQWKFNDATDTTWIHSSNNSRLIRHSASPAAKFFKVWYCFTGTRAAKTLQDGFSVGILCTRLEIMLRSALDMCNTDRPYPFSESGVQCWNSQKNVNIEKRRKAGVTNNMIFYEN